MLKESAFRRHGMADFDDEELFDKMDEMGTFKTGLPKVADRGKLEAWDQSRLTNPSPTGIGSLEDLDDERDAYMQRKEFITLPLINDPSGNNFHGS